MQLTSILLVSPPFDLSNAGTATDGSGDAVVDALAAAVRSLMASDLTHGAWADEAPPVALPYAVVVDLGGQVHYDSSSSDLDESQAAITIFAASKATARSLARTLRADVRDVALSVTGSTPLYVRPHGPVVVRLDDTKGTDGGDVWRADLTVRCLVDGAL